MSLTYLITVGITWSSLYPPEGREVGIWRGSRKKYKWRKGTVDPKEPYDHPKERRPSFCSFIHSITHSFIYSSPFSVTVEFLRSQVYTSLRQSLVINLGPYTASWIFPFQKCIAVWLLIHWLLCHVSLSMRERGVFPLLYLQYLAQVLNSINNHWI